MIPYPMMSVLFIGLDLNVYHMLMPFLETERKEHQPTPTVPMCGLIHASNAYHTHRTKQIAHRSSNLPTSHYYRQANQTHVRQSARAAFMDTKHEVLPTNIRTPPWVRTPRTYVGAHDVVAIRQRQW